MSQPNFSPQKTQILLIGTFHMANPGQDIHNVEAVDVLTSPRQAELDAVTAALARFHPTQVAVEWPAEVTDERYAKFLAGTLPESRNEVVQLGFRLAKACEIPRVLGFDMPGDFPFEAVQAWAEANGRMGAIEQLLAEGAAAVEEISARQQKMTIGQLLRYLNEPELITLNHAFYPPMLKLGSGNDQPGAALLAAWYARNLAICARVVQEMEPGGRMVVFYGQGHIYLMRQFLSEQADIELVDASLYLPA
ncbi:MAG TPA: DUF5694 domain-containing protein [Anaerolineales bacterium]|nr:DUF5694 domain-containing protein [Anaerolineales bacterium]